MMNAMLAVKTLAQKLEKKKNEHAAVKLESSKYLTPR